MSNAALRNLQRTQAASGGAPRWSVLLAAAGAGDDFTINSAVMFDLTDSPNYGLITLGASAVLTIDSTKHTRLNCAGMIRSMGSKYLAYPTYAATHTLNLTGTRARETASIPGNISAPLTAVPSANRAMLGMAGSERRWISQGLPADVIVKLLINASAGATSITLDRPVTWKAGWKIHHT